MTHVTEEGKVPQHSAECPLCATKFTYDHRDEIVQLGMYGRRYTYLQCPVCSKTFVPALSISKAAIEIGCSENLLCESMSLWNLTEKDLAEYRIKKYVLNHYRDQCYACNKEVLKPDGYFQCPHCKALESEKAPDLSNRIAELRDKARLAKEAKLRKREKIWAEIGWTTLIIFVAYVIFHEGVKLYNQYIWLNK